MRRLIFILVIITALLMASFVFFSPYILRHLNVDTLIKEKIKDELGRPVDFEYMQLQLFPAVTLNMKNFTIQDRSFFKGDELLRIGKIGLQLNIMPLFAKRVEIQKFIFKDVTLTIRQRSNKLNVKELMLDQAIHAAKKSRGKDINRSKDNKEVSVLKRDSFFDFIISELIVKNATVTYIKLDDKGDILFQESAYFLDSSFKNAGFSRDIDFKIKVAPSYLKNYVYVRGNFSMDAGNIVDSLEGNAHLSTTDFNIGDMFKKYFPTFPYNIEKGILSLEIDINKTKEHNALNIKGDMDIEQCLIPFMEQFSQEKEEIRSNCNFDISLQMPLESLQVNTFIISFGTTHVQAEGSIHLKDQMIDGRVYSTQCAFKDIPVVSALVIKHIPPAWDITGDSAFDIFMKGNFFKQNIKVNFDFTKNDLRFGRYYHKPPDFPLKGEADMNLESRRSLGGPFNLQLGSLTLKGDIQDFDMHNNEGEFTFLTNKFMLDALGKQLLLAEGFDMSGRAKVLCNAKGKMTDIEKLKFNVGVTLDDVNMQHDNLSLRELNTFVSIDPHTIEISEAECFLYGSYMKGWAKVERYRENPNVNFDIFSSDCNLDTIVQNLIPQKDIQVSQGKERESSSVPSTQKKQQSKQWINNIQRMKAEGAFYFTQCIYKNFPFEDLKGVIQLNDGLLRIESIDCKGWDGQLSAEAEMDFIHDPFTYSTIVNGGFLNVEKLFLFLSEGRNSPLINGVLSVDAHISGQGFTIDELERNLQGEGRIRIRNGELKKIDILQALSTVKQLLRLENLSYGGTRFQDIDAFFVIDAGNVTTDEIVLISEDFTVKASGSVSLRGSLDYALDVFLAPELSGTIIKDGREGEIVNIPLKITGTVHKPRYSVTGAAVSKLVDNLLQQGLKSILDIPEKKKKEPVNDGTVITDETAPAASTSKPITDEHTDTVTQKKGELSRDALIEDTLRRGLDLLLKEKSE